jgi:hypothetical protein
MAITAKMQLATKAHHADGQSNLRFVVDYQDGRNKEWSKYTPGGQIELTVKSEVAEHFKLGGSYLVTFEPDEA